MRTGFALTMYRSAAFPNRTARGMPRPAVRPRILSLVAGIFFATLLAAQAQESIEPDILPSLAEPPAAPAKSSPSTSTEPLPALPQSLPSAPAEPLPSSSASLPSSAEAFPATSEPLSSSINYTTAATTVVPAPMPAGPNGAVDVACFRRHRPTRFGKPQQLRRYDRAVGKHRRERAHAGQHLLHPLGGRLSANRESVPAG